MNTAGGNLEDTEGHPAVDAEIIAREERIKERVRVTAKNNILIYMRCFFWLFIGSMYFLFILFEYSITTYQIQQYDFFLYINNNLRYLLLGISAIAIVLLLSFVFRIPKIGEMTVLNIKSCVLFVGSFFAYISFPTALSREWFPLSMFIQLGLLILFVWGILVFKDYHKMRWGNESFVPSSSHYLSYIVSFLGLLCFIFGVLYLSYEISPKQ